MKNTLFRILGRSLFRSTHTTQLPSSAFFCATPYFLSVLPTTTSTLRSRFISTTPFINQQLQQQSSSSSAPPPPPPASLPSSSSPPPPSPPSSSSAVLLLPAQPQPDQNLHLLPLLKLQPSHYITIHINSFPFLVTPGDLLTLPFRLPDVQVGDILRLTHASILGSRDYTIKGSPYVDENLFELRARVVEVTSEPMRIKIKKKQRNRRTKTVKSKHRYTVLRIGELVVKDAPEVAAAGEGQTQA